MNYIKFLTEIPFWTNDGEDYPTLQFFKSTYLYKTIDFPLSEFSINWETDLTAKITIPLNKKIPFPQYLSIEIVGKPTRYYYATNIYMETNTSTTYNLSLDIWGTYIIPLLEQIKDIPLKTTRNHILNKNAYQLSDALLNSVPVSYALKTTINKNFPFQISGDTIINSLKDNTTEANRFVITKADTLLNGNIYYVFSGDGQSDTANYYAIPVLAKAQAKGILTYRYQKKESKLDSYTVAQGRPSELVAAQNIYNTAVNKGLLAKFIPSWGDIQTQPNQCLLERTSKTQYFPNPFGKPTYSRITTDYISINGVAVKQFEIAETSNTDFPPLPQQPFYFRWEYYSQAIAPTIYTKEISNFTSEIKKLVDKTEFINKFQGIFFLPNFINFYNDLVLAPPTSFFKDMLMLKIGASGIGINLSLPWENLTNRIPEKWNETDITNIQIKEFEKYSYFNNTKKWADYTENFDLNLNGIFVFNGSGSFFPLTSKLKAIDSTINFPYQLPSATDGYIEYYSRNMSSVNNGIAQQEIQYNLSKDKLIGGAIFGAAGIVQNAVGSKGVAGGISTALSAGNFAFNTAMASRDLERQNQSYYKGLAAQYDDIQRNSGANFAPSNVNDSTNIIVQLDTQNHAEIMEKMILTTETTQTLNNILYLYGNINIGTYTLSELTSQHLGFNYIKFSEPDVFNVLSAHGELRAGIPASYFKMIVDFLCKGFRLHDNFMALPGDGPNITWGRNPLKKSILRTDNGETGK